MNGKDKESIYERCGMSKRGKDNDCRAQHPQTVWSFGVLSHMIHLTVGNEVIILLCKSCEKKK